jgi:glucuronoarabinoxylan endo-1,4-beta-xylanase
MGNYSKFVRPGFLRVSATGAPQAGVFVTAFRDQSGEQLAIVAINATDAEISQAFQVDGAELDTMTPYVTSDELALERLDEQPVVDGGFSYTLPALSVTTFVTNPTNIEAPDGGPDGPRYPTRPVSNESGCSCRVTTRGGDGSALLAILGVGLFAVRARRRAASPPVA